MAKVERIPVGSAELAYAKIGSGPTGLVFLHEGLGSIDLWRDFPERVSRSAGESGIVYDRHGHGRSTEMTGRRDDRYLHDAAFEELHGFLAQIPTVDPILIGHSDGATIALLYATRHPVAGLVLIAPHVFVEVEAADGIRRTDQTAEALIGRLDRYHDRARELYLVWRDIWLDPEFASWNITGEIEGVDVPILSIQGRDDEYGTLEQLDRIESAVVGPTERLVIEGGGHSPHLSHTDEVTAATARFIRATRKGRRPAS